MAVGKLASPYLGSLPTPPRMGGDSVCLLCVAGQTSLKAARRLDVRDGSNVKWMVTEGWKGNVHVQEEMWIFHVWEFNSIF